MSQVNQFSKSLNDEFVYFDVLATNAGGQDTGTPPILTFNQTRAVPIINNTGDYNMSITRFSLDTPRLPILAVQPKNQTPFIPDETIYTIGIELVDRVTNAVTASYTNSVTWEAEDPFIYPPSTYPGITDIIPYYHCHSYKYFLSLVNKQLTFLIQTHLTTLKGNVFPPLFSWEQETQSIVLYCNQLFNEYNEPLATGDLFGNIPLSSSNIPLIRITMNDSLQALFAGFASTYDSVNKMYRLRIFNTNYPNEAYRNYLLNYDAPPTPPVNSPSANTIPAFNEAQDSIVPPAGSSNFLHQFEGIYLIVKSEVTGCDLWSPVASIVFTTSLIPIVSNQLSSPIIFKDGVIQNINQSANFAQVITDFISAEQGMRLNILYNPTAEYRRVQLYGNAPLTNIDVSVFWKSKFGEFVPFRLNAGASASIKILFEKKKNNFVQ